MVLLLKYGLIAAVSGLWISGLFDQLHSLASVGKYLTLSAIMVLFALL